MEARAILALYSLTATAIVPNRPNEGGFLAEAD
jgi:hypothetical protein